LIQTYMPAEAW